MTNAIETIQLTKNFNDVLACNSIDLQVQRGEIHALLGENGAGKTTLMKMLFGEVQPTSGSIKINGEEIAITSPAIALGLSIGFIHQHFTLVDEFTIGQNFALGIEPIKNRIFTDQSLINEKSKKVLDQLDIELPLDVPVGNFSVEERQIIEIGKALYRGADILILDEPTSVLTPQKIEKLLMILRKLKSEGKTIIIITHKLEEALSVADQISVLRKGELVGTLSRGDTSCDEIIKLMVGAEVVETTKKNQNPVGKTFLRLEGITVTAEGRDLLKNVSLEIARGEIFSLTGVGGNGQAELVEVITGLRKPTSGEVWFDDKNVTNWDIRKRRLGGIAYVPEDRLQRGSATTMPVLDNIVMGHHYRGGFRQGAVINHNKWDSFSRDIISKFDVVCSSLEIMAGSLSGGNLQKLVIGRELSMNATLLIVAYPSQGIDIRTTNYVQSELIRHRDAGCAILLVSGDMDEIFKLSDRIGVMYSGELVAICNPEEIDRFGLGQYMVGLRRQEVES